jgi:DNA-binding XRE family transcriptional regulator
MNDMITIPIEDYARLMEAADDLADLQAVGDYKVDPKPGVHSEFVARMLAGESLLKLWREHRGYSQNELGKITGVNRIQIGDIEDRGKTGSVITLKKLANALNIQVDDLL